MLVTWQKTVSNIQDKLVKFEELILHLLILIFITLAAEAYSIFVVDGDLFCCCCLLFCCCLLLLFCCLMLSCQNKSTFHLVILNSCDL